VFSIRAVRVMIRLTSVASHRAIILFIFFSQHAAGQQGTIPCGLNYTTYKSIPEKNFPPKRRALVTSQQQQVSEKVSSETVAYNFETHLVPNTDGEWKTIVPGIDSWFLKLRSNSAYGLALVLSGVALKTGETLYVYNQNDLRGPYTNQNVPHSGILALDFLQGDEVMIEYDVPAVDKNHGSFVVETVSHAYRMVHPAPRGNIFDHDVHNSKELPTSRTSNECYPCLENDTADQERRSVVKLVVQYDSTVKICTGTLVNNTAGDKRPYVLTAKHCVSDQFDADRTVFIFDFEDDECVEQTNHNYLTLNGASLRASSSEHDFSILELYAKPPLEFRPYYAGWDIADQLLSGVTCIHHPQGGPKKISVSNGTVVTSNLEDGSSRAPNAFWNVMQWDVGATEGGSSGAPLFNKTSHVMGTLSGGSSQCGAPYNDYFEKLSASWEASADPGHQLKYWLDPVMSGVQRLDGTDPFEGINPDCSTKSNTGPGEQLNLIPYAGGQGYYSGYNSQGMASYAEKFTVADSGMLTGVMLNVGSVNVNSPGGLLVSIHSNKEGIPGPALSESYVPYYRLTEDSLNYVEFYPYVKLRGDFFISYSLSYSPGDSLALKQVNWRSNSNNTAFVKLSSGWVPMTTISPSGAGSSLGIKVTVCENHPIEPPDQETFFSVYPNPANDVLIGKLPDNATDGLDLQVYDLQGKLQTVMYNTYGDNIVITTTDLAPGMYIVRFSSLNVYYQAKFIKL
jgi:lysyl endopeptidase